MGKLTDKTLIPLGLAVLVIGSGAAWVTRIEVHTQAQAQEISEVKSALSTKLRTIEDKLDDVRERLSRIEGLSRRHRRGDPD